MRNKDNTERRERKTTITAQMTLMVVMLGAIAFAAGYYLAAMQIAAMVTK